MTFPLLTFAMLKANGPTFAETMLAVR